MFGSVRGTSETLLQVHEGGSDGLRGGRSWKDCALTPSGMKCPDPMSDGVVGLYATRNRQKHDNTPTKHDNTATK